MSKRRRYLCGALAVFVGLPAACAPNSGSGRSSEPGSGSTKKASAATPAKTTKAKADSEEEAAPEREAPATPTEASESALDRYLEGPTLATWKPEFKSSNSEDLDGYSHRATVVGSEVKIYGDPGDRWAIGLARLGSVLPAKPASGRCGDGGRWFQVSGGAYACSDGLKVREASDPPVDLSPEDRAKIPKIDKPAPFHYVKVKLDGVPRLERLPEEDELDDLDAAVEAGRGAGSIVRQWLDGTYLLALSREVKVGDQKFYETVAGNFVRAQDLEEKPTPEMRGEKLTGDIALPLAFALEETPVYCTQDEEEPSECGTMEKHARFPVKDRIEHDGEKLVVGPEGVAAPRGALRIAEEVERPDGVGDDDKWMHINLSQQTITAYEGDEPVYVTLVSSGLPTHATPNGLFKVERKYLSKTMRGTDSEGPYEVQEVPWTMYYDGNYAVHGAYWHNRFGKTKSHGCTNVPPADARWLYHWAELKLPTGWHAMFHKRGTYVYITGKTPPEMPE